MYLTLVRRLYLVWIFRFTYYCFITLLYVSYYIISYYYIIALLNKKERRRERKKKNERNRFSKNQCNGLSHSVNTHSLYCILSLNLCVGRSFHSDECALVLLKFIGKSWKIEHKWDGPRYFSKFRKKWKTNI